MSGGFGSLRVFAVRGGWLVADYRRSGLRPTSWSARAWTLLRRVIFSKVALVSLMRLVSRTTSASSVMRLGKEWQAWPVVVRLLAAFRLASGERSALATGSA